MYNIHYNYDIIRGLIIKMKSKTLFNPENVNGICLFVLREELITSTVHGYSLTRTHCLFTLVTHT